MWFVCVCVCVCVFGDKSNIQFELLHNIRITS